MNKEESEKRTSIKERISKRKGFCPKFVSTISPGVRRPTEGRSGSLSIPENASPNFNPFFVYITVLFLKFTQHPIVSPVVKVGPYAVPPPVPLNKYLFILHCYCLFCFVFVFVVCFFL